jgi:hypothetical protein
MPQAPIRSGAYRECNKTVEYEETAAKHGLIAAARADAGDPLGDLGIATAPTEGGYYFLAFLISLPERRRRTNRTSSQVHPLLVLRISRSAFHVVHFVAQAFLFAGDPL